MVLVNWGMFGVLVLFSVLVAFAFVVWRVRQASYLFVCVRLVCCVICCGRACVLYVIALWCVRSVLLLLRVVVVDVSSHVVMFALALCVDLLVCWVCLVLVSPMCLCVVVWRVWFFVVAVRVCVVVCVSSCCCACCRLLHLVGVCVNAHVLHVFLIEDVFFKIVLLVSLRVLSVVANTVWCVKSLIVLCASVCLSCVVLCVVVAAWAVCSFAVFWNVRSNVCLLLCFSSFACAAACSVLV